MKLLQLISGLDVFIFWVSAFLWDLIMFTMMIILFIVALAPVEMKGWSSPCELGCLFVIFFVVGFSVLPMTYFTSLFFTNHAYGVLVSIFVNLLTGKFLNFYHFRHAFIPTSLQAA